MIKHYLLLLLMSASGYTFAQRDYIAIKGGINLVTQKFSGPGFSITADRATKMHVGLVANEMLSDQVALQAELQFSQHGFKPDDGLVDVVTFNYIATPLMLKFYPSENISIHAGLEMALVIGGTKVNDVSISEEVKDLNVSFGFGMELMLSDQVGLSGRYLIGLSDINDSPDVDFSIVEQKTDNIQVSLFIVL